jgi:hypothetical protein
VPKLQPYVLTIHVSLPVSAGRSFLKLIINVSSESKLNKLKLSTTDLLVLASMKNAAKCDK